jgi:hypothetical protein
MKETTPVTVVRYAHRWSGLLLIALVGTKIVSGLRLAGATAFPAESTAQWMHFSRWIDAPLLFLFVFHSAYGIFKVLMARGIRNKVRVFAAVNLIALAVFAFFVRFLY